MKSNYKKIGDLIQLVNERNKELKVKTLLGLSISKQFIPSVANTVGTNMRNYKIIRKNQFACSIMQVRRDKKMPVALLQDFDEAIISQAYPVFEVKDENVILPQYLMMWMSRSEFDRHACFLAVGGVRGSLEWEDFGNMELPVPSIEKQRAIVKEYNTVINRIKINEQLNQKLEETAQALYRHWFVDFEFPDKNGKPYKSSGGKMVWNEELEKEIPEGWEVGSIADIADIEMGQSPRGETYNDKGIGTPLINGPVEFGAYFTKKIKWTTSPTKLSSHGDLIICVRGSTTGRFVKSDGIYCLGRGVCSLRGKESQVFLDLFYQYHLKELLSFTTGSTFPNWSRDTLLDFPAIIPKKNIIKKFDKIVSLIPIHQSIIFQEIRKLNEFSQILLLKLSTISKEDFEEILV